MRGRASESMLACRRACCLYLNLWIYTDYTDALYRSLPVKHRHSASALQKSLKMSDKNPQNELRSGIEGYDPKQMKKVVTKEKNPLPTQCQIDEEKKAQMCPEKSKK